MSKMYKFIVLAMLLVSSVAFAQTYKVSGKVTSAQTGENLIGANVYVKGLAIGAATDADGMYEFNVPKGSYTIVCSFIGFEAAQLLNVNVTNNMELDFQLKDYEFSLSVTVLADRAKERETPVAFTNIDKKDMEMQLGSQDIPLILNTTPSVYSTNQGGGAGDARINVRGFNQRNVAIMINGVPVNDMENGWVYWSNWDGVGDATSSIQVQRGLSAVNLATPSIGGTMNIITDPTAQEAGVYYKTEMGSGNFAKQTLFANTGLVDDKFALTVGGVRKTGDGLVDGAWTDAWAYYFGAAYQINTKNRLELYATGAPQRHGQRTYALNAATFSHELALDLGFSNEILRNPAYADQGLLYNSNWSPVSTSYQGNQYWNTSQSQRYDPTFINERENYYHKPIVNLNWYSQLSDKLSLYTTAYYSGGTGGGTGTFGSMGWNYSLKQRVVDYDATLARNLANTEVLDGQEQSISRGILRNSVNNQWTVGLLSKAFYKVNKELKLSFGLDWRLAEVEHYREVRDLLGGYAFKFEGNDFDSGGAIYKKLGDRIDYNNTNDINWLGGYVQAEYTKDRFSIYGTGGYSVIKYFLTDHFTKVGNGQEKEIESDYIGGYQGKGGVNFRVNTDLNVYVNAGYVSKVPIFDQVIDDITVTLVEDYKNETFISGELGANWKGLDNKLSLNANVYYTKWDNRATSRGVTNQDGSEGVVYLDGIAQTHMGVEVDFAYQPVRYFRLDGAGSFGMWEYNDDVSGSYVEDKNTGVRVPFDFYLKDLKVGDAPQTQFALAASVFPVNGLTAQIVWRLYDSYYSNFDPFSRTDETDRAQVWQVPSYNIFDLHFAYQVPVESADVTVFAHVFNLLNELYVQDATDNSRYNGYSDNGTNHSADDAEIYPGLPTNFNLGISVGL
jgi:iron complex outermembrane receptor protein